MRKRLMAMLLAVILVITAMPVTVMAAANPKLDAKAVCYTPQNDYKSGDCILTASKVMIRRASILRGSKKWSSITNKTLRSPATVLGLLLHNFKFEADGLQYKIGMGLFSGNDDATRIKQFEKLIKQHPEGVVVWGSNSSRFGMHGVLLVDVRKGVPYVMDSAYNVGSWNSGILKWSDSSMKNPKQCTQYWYIKEVGIAKGAKAPASGKPLAAASAGSISTASTLSINDETIPTEIREGNGYPVEGHINSNYRIKKVEVAIIGSSGKAVISKSASPNDWCYDLADLDRYFKFGTLSPGTYKYRIKASDEKRSVTFVNSPFTVISKDAPTLSISGENQPSSINIGGSFYIKGKIKSNTNISSVRISVIDSSGKTKLSASAKPGSRSYNLRKLDPKVKFGKLKAGKYRYVVRAKAGSVTKTLINCKFSVVAKSRLRISLYNYPTSIKEGSRFFIWGRVTSDKLITKVSVKVVDGSGKVKFSASESPKSKSYNILRLDPKIKFRKLSRGTYRYKVIATDKVMTKTLVNKKFTVR